MRFPTPEVVGVFLKLPERVESTITDGDAAHYLHGHPPGSASPKRLRNNLGFHGAVAEFVDAFLERAVLPYQTTDMLPSLTILPDADFRHRPGSAAPYVFCPVEFGSAIAYAKNRARLGHEKRLAPLEFWRDMIRGSDALARHMEPVVLPPPPDEGSSDDGSSDDGYDAIVYPSVLYPRSLMLPLAGGEGREGACGFYDLCDTQWESTVGYPGAWMPEQVSPWLAPAGDLSYLGHTALEVFSMLEFPSSWRDRCSMPMVAELAGFDSALPWPWGPGSSLYVHWGFYFAGYRAVMRRWDWDRYPDGPPREWWPIDGGPYSFGFVDDILASGLYPLYPPPDGSRIIAKACFEAAPFLSARGFLPSADGLRTSWISPYDWNGRHAFIKPTARPNLDILRIQQVLLGSMWANWAKIPVEIKIPHRLTTTKYNYVVHMDGGVELVDSATTEAYPREVNKAVWSHGVSCDSGGGQGGSACYVSFPFDLCKLRKSYSDVVDEYEPPEGLEEARQEMAAAESVLALDLAELVNRMTQYNFAGDMASTNSDQLRVEIYISGSGSFFSEAFPYTLTSTVSEIAGQMMAAAKALAVDHPGAGSFSTYRHVPAGDFWNPDWYNISGDWFTPAMWQHLADYGEAKRVLDPLEAADCGIAVDVSGELFKALKKAVDDNTADYEFCNAPEGDDGSSGSSDDVTVPFSVTTWWRRPYGLATIEFAERRSDSPWPAASVVEGGYVNAETLALGLTAEDTIEGWVDKPADRTYERRRVDGSGEIVYPTHTICRRVAMRNNSSQVSVSTPATVLAQLVADLTQNAQPETEISDPLLAARFLPFSMLPPYPHGVAGARETDPSWEFPPVYAWYHPDKSPEASGCSDDGSDDGSSGAGLEVFPYRITATNVCGAEVETYWASPDEAYINRLPVEGWMTFTYPYGDAPTCDESFMLNLSDHIALRAVWNWKSMPVIQE